MIRVLDHHPAEDHDPRSVQNFHVARFVSDVPTKGTYWNPPSWRLDQGQTGHCGGMASINEAGASPFRYKPPKPATPIDHAHNFYYCAKDWQLDPWGREDGTSTLAMMKVGQRLGHWQSYAWARTLDDLKRNLQVGPFLFGVPMYTGMFSPDSDGIIRATGQPAGGHLMCAFAWSPNWRNSRGKQKGPMLSLAQSWGRDHGDGGIVRLPLEDAAMLLSQGEAGVPVGRKLVTA